MIDRLSKNKFESGNQMRVRKKKHGAERIEACASLLIKDPSVLKENISKCFEVQTRPVHLEIGCGKGNFICGMSAVNQDVNFIAMERVADVACVALEKAIISEKERTDNLKFIIGDAQYLTDWLPEHSLDCIYINFCDPWPKAGHKKRRLTYSAFLNIYRKLLKSGGLLRFKTDNEGLFDFSLEQFSECGLTVEWMSRDLHSSECADGNIMTEYERNFSSAGMPIYCAYVRF